MSELKGLQGYTLQDEMDQEHSLSLSGPYISHPVSPPPGRRASAHRGGKAPSVKRPRQEPRFDDEDFSLPDTPDLDWFLSRYEMPAKQRVLLCRAYASMLSAQMKSQQ